MTSTVALCVLSWGNGAPLTWKLPGRRHEFSHRLHACVSIWHEPYRAPAGRRHGGQPVSGVLARRRQRDLDDGAAHRRRLHLAAYGELGDTLSLPPSAWQARASSSSPMCSAANTACRTSSAFRHHLRHCLQLWNVTFVCLLGLAFLAKEIETFSRGWILLFYASSSDAAVDALPARPPHHARAPHRADRHQAHFLVGTGDHIGEIVRRYQPWELGASIVGCRFLTPAPSTASPQMRSDLLDRDIEATLESARSLEPDAILIVTSSSDTATIDRCIDG